jgi:hypothetical protein
MNWREKSSFDFFFRVRRWKLFRQWEKSSFSSTNIRKQIKFNSTSIFRSFSTVCHFKTANLNIEPYCCVFKREKRNLFISQSMSSFKWSRKAFEAKSTSITQITLKKPQNDDPKWRLIFQTSFPFHFFSRTWESDGKIIPPNLKRLICLLIVF